jgi:hypothetical protein
MGHARTADEIRTATGRFDTEILAAHRGAKWYGVIAYILLRAGGKKRALWQALLLGRWGFVPAWCEYKKHWYFRHIKGRKPDACILHGRARRQATWYRFAKKRRQRETNNSKGSVRG